MTDRYDQDQMLDYLEGEGDAASRAAFEQVMANDPHLASLVKELSADRDLLRSLPDEMPPHTLTQEVLQGIERRMLLDGPTEEASAPIPIARGRDLADTGLSFRWGRVLGLSGMAAAVALAATLVVVFANHDPLSHTALNLAKDDPDNSDPETLAGAGANAPSDDDGQPGEAGAAFMEPRNLEADLLNADADRSALSRAREALMAHEGNLASDNPGNGAVAAVPPGAGVESAPIVVPAVHTIGQVASGDANAIIFNNSVAFDQQLTIQSESPELSQQQVFDYCVRNGIPIVETQPTSIALNARNNFAVVVEDEQLAEIESMLNDFVEEPDAVYSQRQQAEVMPNMRAAQLPNADTEIQQRTRSQDAPDHLNQIGQVEARNDADWALNLVVPEKLGTEEQVQQNRDNVTTYNNRLQLAQNLAPPQNALAFGDMQSEVLDGAGHDEDAGEGDLNDAELNDTARQADAGHEGAEHLEEVSPHSAATDDNTNENPEAMGADESQAETPRAAAEADGPALDSEEVPAAQPARRRGNWLSPQIPRVPSQPLWSTPPRARLVELIIVPVETERADATELAPPQRDAWADSPEAIEAELEDE